MNSVEPVPSLNQKINDLFSTRLLLRFCMELQTDVQERQNLFSHLTKLQRSIYDLDTYGEQTWNLDKTHLSILWNDINASLSAFGFDKNIMRQLLSDIHSFQEIEEQLRLGNLPTKNPIEMFYHFKTCDVRMSRQILVAHSKKINSPPILYLWNLFDLASEVLDDLLDIDEDITTFNGNRYLLSSISQSTDSTNKEYLSFLKELGKQATLAGNARMATIILSKIDESILLLKKVDRQLIKYEFTVLPVI